MIAHFLITSTICLLVFYLFYKLFIENLSIHGFKRFYLIATLIISFTIPFVKYEIVKEIKTVVVQSQNTIQKTNLSPTLALAKPEQKETISFDTIFWFIYSIVAIILVVRILFNIAQLYRSIKRNEKIISKNDTLVLVNQEIIPHSWFKYILVNKTDFLQNKINAEIIEHERIHVNLFHSVDILFIELLKAIFWFNPLYFLYKNAIKLNHEFQADSLVIKNHNIYKYQHILLSLSGKNQNFMVNTSNYSITKKRLLMMTQKTNKTLAIIFKLLIIPLVSLLFYTFCIDIVAQEKSMVSTTKHEDKLRDAYYSNVYVKIFDERNNINFVKRYEELSLEEKRKYLDFIPEQIFEKKLSSSFFNKIKTKNMVVWIDGKAVNRTEISKYNPTDFSYYTESFIHKNARSKKFPQEYQYFLYTKDYFEKNLKNSHLHFTGDTVKIGFTKFNAHKNSTIKDKNNILTSYTSGKTKNEYNLYLTDTVKKKNITNMPQKDGIYYDETGSYDTNGNHLNYGYIIKNNELYYYIDDKKSGISMDKKVQKPSETTRTQMEENSIGFENKNYRFVNNTILDENNNKVCLKSLATKEKGYLYIIKAEMTGTYYYVISDDKKSFEIYNRWGFYQKELSQIFNN